MREVIMKVYTVEELSEKALSRAYDEWLNDGYYPWGRENEDTMLEFEKIFPIQVYSWEYGGGYDYVRFYMTCNDDIEELEGFRLSKYIWNNYRHSIYKDKYYSKRKYVDGKHEYVFRHSKIKLEKDCPLTGYYVDYDILKPLHDFLDSPKPNVTFKDLMQECLNSWINACRSDYDNYFSKDNFIEEARNNEWEYYEDGSMF